MYAARTRKLFDLLVVKECRWFSGKGGPPKPEMNEIDKDGFRIFKIPGLHKTEAVEKRREPYKKLVPPAREKTMSIDQDWTDVWPTAATFNPSVVPLPIRQGFVDNGAENEGIIPDKYNNTELLKVVNFLHLTPRHIRKHCAAIKKFCSRWPDSLNSDEECDKHFPLSITTSDYIMAGPSLRDPRSRKVSAKFSLERLDLDEHARDKIIRLLGDRYDEETGEVTLTADCCPVRKQNTDYVKYLLTALYFESWKIEPWEEEITWADLVQFEWDKSKAKQKFEDILRHTQDDEEDKQKINEYGKAVTALHNDGENDKTLALYKTAVLNFHRQKTV